MDIHPLQNAVYISKLNWREKHFAAINKVNFFFLEPLCMLWLWGLEKINKKYKKKLSCYIIQEIKKQPTVKFVLKMYPCD